ncbi:ComEC/Rec2 family competence protein [Ensifer adhaerens]|uniref:ComEC/Rec2 family competence protein n=1 Tax=Ensifer adhaerens TaxID=106592 RepID=UPI0011789873|nr:metallohydrolase [Ensifer adhaerens]
MADKLLVRMFDVGLGDFIYCAIPGAHESGRDFHMVIDCGSLSGDALIRNAVPLMKEMLPLVDGKKRLDLLIVSHQHKDHMSGFGLPLWDDISIGAIWMSAAMKPDNDHAKRAKKLHELAGAAMEQAAAFNLGSEFGDLFAAYAANNDTSVRTLTELLPKGNGIQPVYVSAGQSTSGELSLPLKDAVFEILGPEQEIDRWYLGTPKESHVSHLLALAEKGVLKSALPLPLKGGRTPTNIAAIDFRNLQSRMLATGLALSDADGAVVNNTSVVLLVTWREKRLLFVGDAEWEARFKEGAANSAWNTMWNLRRDQLKGPLDFLKVGHHGSENATPWDDGIERDPDKPFEPAVILDAILPKVSPLVAQAAVSTKRSNYKTIPRSLLLNQVATRIANAKSYGPIFKKGGIDPKTLNKFKDYEEAWFSRSQPPRTDFENITAGADYIDIPI